MPDVQVTNRNSFPMTGRFAAKDYVFPAGKPVSIPEKAAEHIFGLSEESKTGALNRLGLLKAGRTLEEAHAALDNVSFAHGRTVYPDDEPLPPSHEEQPIGDSPGAPRSPGGESGVEAAHTVSAADALAHEILAGRRKRGGG